MMKHLAAILAVLVVVATMGTMMWRVERSIETNREQIERLANVVEQFVDSVNLYLEQVSMPEPGVLYHRHTAQGPNGPRVVEVRTERAEYGSDEEWIDAHAARVAEALANNPPI
jgi:hypothetical protein